MLTITKPVISRAGDEVRISATLSGQSGQQEIWYSVNQAHADYLTAERADGFVLAALLAAMRTGEDIRVHGSLSEKLAYNINNYYSKILSIVNPGLRRVRVLADHLESGPVPGRQRGVATGFSGGIDSFCAVADHLFGDVPPGFRLTHLLFHNVGSHGEAGRALFRRRYEKLRPLAEQWGLPFIAVDSNLDEILGWVRFLRTHTLRNASAAMMLQGGIGRYLYSSGLQYSDCYVGDIYTCAYYDPVATPLLSSDGLECILTGAQYSRVEKTRIVSDVPASYFYLDVCINQESEKNCSVCQKCMRTMLTLDILGKLHHYEQVFNLDEYKKRRQWQMAKVLRADGTFAKEIASYAKEHGYKFPLMPRAASLMRVKTLRRMARAVITAVKG